MTAPLELPGAAAWRLDPSLAYLNHGGFGAAPLPVLAEQRTWRDAMERNPTGFLVRDLPEQLHQVRALLAGFLGADADGLVFVGNATAGTQTVLAQVGLAPGDEVLVTDHCYPAALAQVKRATAASGATLRVAEVPMPAGDQETVLAAVTARLGPRTALVVIDHVASCSGLVFPVEQIVAECHARGVPVLVDGAHATGQLPVDLGRLGADFWTGNLHKWLCAPKAAAVLQVAERWRDRIRPLVASHGFADGYQPAFDWTGTQDPTPLLAAPAAVAFFGQAGWQAVRAHNQDLARRGAELVAGRVGTTVPGGAGLTGAMRLVPLPRELTEAEARALETSLLDRYRIVVPVTYLGGWRWLRVSAQLYNTMTDYERLADALAELLA